MPYIKRYGVGEDGDPAGVRIPLHVGDIVFSPLATPREGTLVCDGSAVSRQAYKALFDFLGTACGEGDGETTFNLPDLRDQWILCAGTEHTVGEKVGEGLPNLVGRLGWSEDKLFNVATGAFTGVPATTNIHCVGSPTIQTKNIYCAGEFNASAYNSIYGASEHVTPKSTVLTPCIAYE